jgi:hypothetical protein
MKTKELSKRKRDNSHYREKNLTEETRDEREEKGFFLLLGRKTQNRNRAEVGVFCYQTHIERRGFVCCSLLTRMEHHAAAAADWNSADRYYVSPTRRI